MNQVFTFLRTSQAGQRLGFQASTAGGTGSIPSQKLKSCVLHARKKKITHIPQAILYFLSDWLYYFKAKFCL